jgi:hypothetical protein
MMASLPHTNGSNAYPPQAWLKQTVQHFFNGINWDDHPPEVQTLRLAGQDEPKSSLLLTVNQFFSTINWEGGAATPPKPNSAPASSAEEVFTLEDFSDLF